MVKNQLAAFIFRIVGFVVAMFGIVVQIVLGASYWYVYFTIQTNIFVAIMFAILAVKSGIKLKKEGKFSEPAHMGLSVQLAITLFITVTFLIYWALLSWQNFSMGDATFQFWLKLSNYFVHLITPIFAIVDYLLFFPHGKLKPIHAIIWLSYPICYMGFLVIRAQLGGVLYNGSKYPYFFCDIDAMGWWSLLVTVIVLVGFWGLGRLYLLLDNKLAKCIKNK